VEYKRPAAAYPLRDFLNKICRVCIMFHGVLAVKTELDLLKWSWSYMDFKLTVSGYPKFSAPPSGETMRQTPKSFRGARTCSRSSIAMPSLVGLDFHPFSFYSAPHCKRCTSYGNSVRLFVCPSVRHTPVLCQNDGT